MAGLDNHQQGEKIPFRKNRSRSRPGRLVRSQGIAAVGNDYRSVTPGAADIHSSGAPLASRRCEGPRVMLANDTDVGFVIVVVGYRPMHKGHCHGTLWVERVGGGKVSSSTKGHAAERMPHLGQ